MKSNKSTPSAKGRTTAKGTPSDTSSPGAKAASSRKIKPVKLASLDAAAPQVQASPPVAHSPDEVAMRAYHNFQKRGSADGGHTDDWLRAETELTAERRLVHA